MSITSSGGEVTNALGGKLTFEQSKNRIVGRDADNLARMLILADGTNFVMKVSKDTFDVITTGDENLIFNSNQNIFKIISKGTTTLTSPNSIGSSTNTTVNYTTGQKQIVLAYASFSPTGTKFPLPIVQPQLTADPNPGLISYQLNFEVIVNGITFYWRDITKANNITAYITYYILQETAT